jgi:hypothetical protein
MIEADSVLSTPPTNTSPVLEANPPPEARAESPKPAEGSPRPDRR